MGVQMDSEERERPPYVPPEVVNVIASFCAADTQRVMRQVSVRWCRVLLARGELCKGVCVIFSRAKFCVEWVKFAVSQGAVLPGISKDKIYVLGDVYFTDVCRAGKLSLAKWLHARGYRIDAGGYGDKRFLELGISSHYSYFGDHDGRDRWYRKHHAPFYAACRRGHVKVVSWLYSEGVPIALYNDYGLMCAKNQCRDSVVAWFASKGCVLVKRGICPRPPPRCDTILSRICLGFGVVMFVMLLWLVWRTLGFLGRLAVLGYLVLVCARYLVLKSGLVRDA